MNHKWYFSLLIICVLLTAGCGGSSGFGTPGDVNNPPPLPSGPTDPGPTDPGPTDPGPTDPGPTDPGPTDPGPTDPGPTDPGPTDPGPTDPGPTDPGPADPGPADPGQVAVALERAYPNLQLNTPVDMVQAPDDISRWFVLERAGIVLSFDATNPATTETRVVIDIRDKVNTLGEGGLLGLAFDPDFATNGEAYLSYTIMGPNPDTPLTSIISRVQSTDGGQTLNPATEQVILRLNQPFTHHNGGHIVFGPDGHLYIGFGDGGGLGGDPLDNGQDINNLYGALLRIDVDNGMDYGIPSGNPFIGGGGAPEIYAYGFRNPWRFSFDRATGTLWLADLGQNHIEEVDIIQEGGNYGWNCFEGTTKFEPIDGEQAGCGPREDYIFPIAQYDHGTGQSITGGYVYRGDAIPGLQGVYVFGDFITGTIFGLFPTDSGGYKLHVLMDTNLMIVSFAQSVSGELYVVDFNGGLYRLISAKSGIK